MTHLQAPLLKPKLPNRKSSPGGETATVVYYEGRRIYYRPVEVGDEPLLRKWINDPSIWQGLPLRPPINANREREWIESQGNSTSDYVFAIVVRDGDRLIGTAGLHTISPVARSATLGISIGDRDFHSKGYGTEAVQLLLRFAFEELNLNRVALAVYANNPRAIRCYQKAGFVQEGCFRQAHYRGGKFHDEYRFAVLREEWQTASAHQGERRGT
ncbi:MAG TPA: GNAT family protein [Phycisphaerae bacterium]|nr:GNAT family protein [Phycisphaerae bacterium]HRY67802.1 GNAT family protein [Phycisphaerae bacterium]HSA25254.1 GNAT family protein [Phycisphaerae bacterium]